MREGEGYKWVRVKVMSGIESTNNSTLHIIICRNVSTHLQQLVSNRSQNNIYRKQYP